MRVRNTLILSLIATVFWRCDRQGGPWTERQTNLMHGVSNGDGLQDGFEGTKRFGWPLRQIDHSEETVNGPPNPAYLLD